jgi:hypothetical protein
MEYVLSDIFLQVADKSLYLIKFIMANKIKGINVLEAFS